MVCCERRMEKNQHIFSHRLAATDGFDFIATLVELREEFFFLCQGIQQWEKMPPELLYNTVAVSV